MFPEEERWRTLQIGGPLPGGVGGVFLRRVATRNGHFLPEGFGDTAALSAPAVIERAVDEIQKRHNSAVVGTANSNADASPLVGIALSHEGVFGGGGSVRALDPIWVISCDGQHHQRPNAKQRQNSSASSSHVLFPPQQSGVSGGSDDDDDEEEELLPTTRARGQSLARRPRQLPANSTAATPEPKSARQRQRRRGKSMARADVSVTSALFI